MPIVRLGTDPLRVVFFSLTFLAIGVNTRLSRFKEIGLGRPLAAYVVGLLWAAVWGAIVAYLVFK